MSFQIPVLEKGCCGCCSVLTCVKVQAILNLIGAIWGTIDTIRYLVALKTLPSTLEDGEPRETELEEAVNTIVLIIYIVHIILNSMLLHGVFTSNYRLIRPYLYADAGSLALFALAVMLFLVVGSVIAAFFAGLILAFSVYCWLHVYTLYVTQKQESQGLNQCAPPSYADIEKGAANYDPEYYAGYQAAAPGYVQSTAAPIQVQPAVFQQ